MTRFRCILRKTRVVLRTILPFSDLVGVVAAIALALAGCAHAPKLATDAQCGPTCRRIDSCLGEEASDGLKSQLCELARCESGCRSTARSPAGYYGLFQFAPKTWRSVCYPIFEKKELPRCRKLSAMNDPCCATICTADMIQQGGVKHWPVCGPKEIE